MIHALLVYDRATGELLRTERFATSVDALTARFLAEEEFRGSDGIEIVALAADSEAEMSRTHGRYFLKLGELAARMS